MQKDKVCPKYIALYIKVSKFYGHTYLPLGFPGSSAVKNLLASAGDTGDAGLILGLGRSPGEGNGNPSNILAWEIPWTEEPDRL